MFKGFIVACLASAIFLAALPPAARADDASTCTGTGPGAAIVAACTALLAAGKLDQDSQVVALYSRGVAYEGLGQHQLAINDYTAAIAIKPNANLYFARGYANEQLGQDTAAIADYTQAIALDPTNLQATTRRGFAYVRNHDYALALADFNAALALNAQAPFALYGRGISYEGLGKYDLAAADFTTVLSAGPNIDAYQNRGQVEYYQQKFAAAAADFGQVYALQNTNIYPLIWEHIALVRAGQPDPNFATATASLDQTTWPSSVVNLFLGKGTKDAVYAQATAGQMCAAEFFIGQWYETQKQHGDAVIYETQATQNCSYGTFEYQASITDMQH